MFKGLPEASEEAKGIISDIQETMSQGFVPSFGDDFAGEMEIADQSLIDFLKTTETSSISLTAYQKYLKQTSSATSTLSVITSGAGKVMKIFAATAINAFASVVVAKVIQEIYEAYDQWANRIEYAAEAMESANSSYEAAETELNKVRSEIEKINAQMLELEKTESGEFVNQEEYDRLKASREELEASVKLLETKLRLEARKSLDTSMNWFLESQKMTSGTSAEYSESAIENRASGIVNGDMKRWYTGDKAEDNITDEKGNINFLLGAYQGLGDLYDQNNQLIKEGADALAEKGETDLKYAAMSIESLTNENSELAASKDLVEVYLHEYKANLQQLVNSYNELQNSGGIVSDEETKQYNAAIALISIINDTLGITAETANTASNSISNHASTVESSLKKTKAEMISELNTLSSGFESLDKIMKSQKDDSAFDYGLLSDNDFVETFGELGDVYTDFVEIISKSPKDVKTCQNAYDNLVTAWINSDGVLRGVSEETANVTEAMLKNMGVVNAAEVVEFALAQQKAKVAWETRESTDAIADEVVELLSESETVDDTTQAWAAYVAQKMLNEVHDGSGDILQLRNVMEALGLGIKAWEAYAHAKKMAIHSQGTFGAYEVVDEGTDGISVTKVSAESSRRGWEKVANATFDELNQQINALIDNSLDIDYGGGNKSTDTDSKSSGSSTTSKEAKKEEIDWLERRKKILQELHDIEEQIANDESKTYDERSASLSNLIQQDEERIRAAEEAAARYEKAWLDVSKNLSEQDKEYVKNGGKEIELYDAQELYNNGLVDSVEAGEEYIENLKKAIEYHDLMTSSEREQLDLLKDKIEHEKTMLQLIREQYELDLDLNSALQDQVNSKMELEEARGNYVNLKYYEELLYRLNQEQAIHEDKLDALYNELDAAKENSAEYEKIQVEIEECKNDIIQCQVEQGELNDTIRRLPIDRLQIMRTLYADIIKDLDNYRSIQDKLGLKPTKEELQQYIDLYSESIDDTIKQQDALKELLKNYSYGGDKFNKTCEEIQALDDEINNLLASQVELNNEMLQIPVAEMSEEIEKLGSLKQIRQNSIDEDNANGLETTLDQYSELHSITLKQLSLYAQQKTELTKLLSVYDKESEYYKDTEKQIAEIDNNISSCVQETYQWNQELLNLPIEKLADINDNLSSYSSILDSVIGEYDSALSGVNVLIDRQVDGIQNQIDALQAANEARKVQLNIEQSLFELERARNQRTIAVIRNGEKIYENDKDAERQAQANHQDALYEKQIYDLEQQIDRLETIRDKWKKITETIKEAKDLQASEDLFGSGWEESVLSDSTELRDIFKSLYESASAEKESVDKQIESNERISQMMSEFATRYQEGSLTYEQAINGINIMIASMQDGYSAMENLSGMMGLDNIDGLENIASSTQQSINDSAELLQQYMGIVESNKQSVEGFETSWNDIKGTVDSVIAEFNSAVGSMDSYIEVFNKNAEAINEHTLTWDEMKQSIADQVEALKKAAEALEKQQKSSSSKTSSGGGGRNDDDEEYDGVIVTGVRFQDGSGYDYGSNGGNFVDMNTGKDLGVSTHGQYISAYTDQKTQDDYWNSREQQIESRPQASDSGWLEAAKAALEEERRQAEENAQKLQTRHTGIFKGAIGDSGSQLEDELISLANLKDNEVPIIAQKGEFVYQPEQILNTLDNVRRDTMEQLLPYLTNTLSNKYKKLDIESITDLVETANNSFVPNVPNQTYQTNDFSIGEIHLHEIQNVDEFAHALEQTWELKMQQNRSKKF